MRLPRVLLAATLCLAAPGVRAVAQPAGGAPGDSAAAAGALARARRLVGDGNGAAGRTLVDSVLAAATPGTTTYADALYWRASLAEHASDAERDFKQLAAEYTTTPRGADAQLRLAQLALVRGQPAAAREYLGRLLRDHADPPTQARAQYWLARAALDADDAAGSCDALNAAAAASPAGSDLARQVVTLRGRVPRCTLRVAVGSASTRDPAPPAVAPRATPPNATPATVPNVTPVASSPERSRGGFTVQVAAFPTRAGADDTAARLAKRGVDARAVAAGTAPDGGPFRVRIGRYATRAEAAAALRGLKEKGLSGFVTDAEP